MNSNHNFLSIFFGSILSIFSYIAENPLIHDAQQLFKVIIFGILGGATPVRTLVPIPLTVIGGGIVYKLKSTYASMIADGTPSATTIYSVTTDENKTLSRSLYILRTDGKREYIPSTPDN